MNESIKIDATLVKRLITAQFPQWQDLSIRQIIPGGWALWKALIVAAKMTESNNVESAACWRIIVELIDDYRLLDKKMAFEEVMV